MTPIKLGHRVCPVVERLWFYYMAYAGVKHFCSTGEHLKGEYLGCYKRQRQFKLTIPLPAENRRPEACVKVCITRGE